MIDEKLSAFLDGEADKGEILDVLHQLRREPALRASLDRHHHVRACLRGEAHPALQAGFADRVMAAIAVEETAEVVQSAKVSRLPTRRHFRTLVGLAMAASVAGAAVIALQSFQLQDPLVSTQTAESTPVADASPLAVADVQSGSTDAAGQSVRWEQLPADAADQLNSYLISHNNYATDHGLGGSLGFMRVTAYDSDEDTQSSR